MPLSPGPKAQPVKHAAVVTDNWQPLPRCDIQNELEFDAGDSPAVVAASRPADV